ncbi:fatty acid/sphingolipid desaturase [Wallemia mellicola]|uniref:Delta 8-(E)-sphingolipid desaturase n=2 Tax=Wallemia mellicola TaxID=1708541 RepID=A0A4T0MDX8_9BASI|nr:fatty acid/sphingolipid desaturase [Wallemia mellicola CBS 633.66]TIB73014.1 hypothetical protein E3Q24_01356 [Wallemia mellicola]EIM20124.1 fatty acid/sphingolipid desaturase [Wallemia mellicola CBS 633.66]TIB77693.1 hypothetical protein E3Q23_01153 [Wallemia mellicola]TIB81067.1 fatty acid/sphingolipid desaturase [Wallemia mellicola]TIC02873.1 fatty acid/sphingolipid desaturase [Wallemia mellicola]|eukprot:XP_006959845.1 fatty acid/sphingolipid desaturase [Wallemia mellicola CBS 633.66]
MKTFTRNAVAEHILQGQILVIYKSKVLRLNSWIDKHPGGDLAILHFVGRDATDEISAYHDDATIEKLLPRFIVGQLDESDSEPFYPLIPPVQLGWRGDKREGHTTQAIGRFNGSGNNTEDKEIEPHLPKSKFANIPLTMQELEPPTPTDESLDIKRQFKISQNYHKLHAEVKRRGLYTIQSDAYLYECIRYTALLVIFALLYFKLEWKVLAAIPLGLFWHQITFVVHDAGHCEIWGSQKTDKTLACFIASYIGGLSANWWCDNHDIHHIVTNHPEHDPDIQHIPFFAISTKFFNSMWSTYYRRVMEFDAFAKLVLPIQHNLYYIVMSVARFNLFALSYIYLLTKSKNDWYRNFEIVGVSVFWTWYGSLISHIPSHFGKFAFLLLSNVAASPVHVQIVLSHFARSTDDLGLTESFAHRQLRTTMDVACPWYLDFLHGGLHMQVSHHLFPRIPRHNLREVRDMVAKFAAENNLEYAEHGFVAGNGQVLDVLRNVGEQVKFVSKVAASEASQKMHKTAVVQ